MSTSTIYICNECCDHCRADEMTEDLMYCKNNELCRISRQREPYPTKVKTIEGKACYKCGVTFNRRNVTSCANFSCPLWVCERCAYKDANDDWCCCFRHGLRG